MRPQAIARLGFESGLETIALSPSPAGSTSAFASMQHWEGGAERLAKTPGAPSLSNQGAGGIERCCDPPGSPRPNPIAPLALRRRASVGLEEELQSNRGPQRTRLTDLSTVARSGGRSGVRYARCRGRVQLVTQRRSMDSFLDIARTDKSPLV